MTATLVIASAPGKAVLSGEYAVLDGAPAVCMAVDRRALARVKKNDADWHCVSAPGHSGIEGRFVVDGNGVEWLQGGDDFGIVEAVWQAVGNRCEGHYSIELDTRAFVDTLSGRKVGIGSSAALTVALSAALAESTDVLGAATEAHRVFQRGSGSGVDIAAAVSGGLIEYCMEALPPAALTWPAGLAYRLIWTGVPASTRARLEKLNESTSRPSRKALAVAASRMARIWRLQSASSVMEAYPEYIEALLNFSVDHDLGIFDAGHEQLVTEASGAGMVYKPCGAGGGDIGILLGAREEQLDEFMARCDASEWQPLDCNLDADGVKLEQL